MQVLKLMRAVALAMLFSSSMVACSGDSWKEEVQLHDGQKIIVDRSQTYGGRNEIGQSPPVKEHTIKFKLPDSGKTITWTSEYGEDLGRTNFQAVALHILNGAPYLVAAPNLCLAYNKWGRPNPPYVIFKYDGSGWPRIPMAELPAEFKDTNLVVNTKGDAKVLTAKRMVTADFVKKLNLELESPEYKTILRNSIRYDPDCIPMVNNGKGLWLAMGFFSRSTTLEACEASCSRENFDDKHCPCKKLFERK